MADVTELFPGVLTQLDQKTDLDSLLDIASANKYIALDHNNIAGPLMAIGRLTRLHAFVAAVTGATQAINGKAFRLTGQDPTTALPTVSTVLTTDVQKAFAAGIEKIEGGGDLDGTASGQDFMGVAQGPLSIASGAFPTGTLLALSGGGGLVTFASGSKLPPIARVLDATTAYVDVGGRLQVDGSTLLFNASGVLVGTAAMSEYGDSGEARGKDRLLGNTDNFDLGFLTNNVERLTILRSGEIGINVLVPTRTLEIVPLTSATIGLHLKEAVGQSVDLMQWQDSSGSVRGFINAGGSFVVGVSTSGSHVIIDPDAPAATMQVFTNAQDAKLLITGTSGVQDAVLGFGTSGTTFTWSTGLDDSASQDYKISQGNLGTNDHFRIDKTTGAVDIVSNDLLMNAVKTIDNARKGFFVNMEMANASLIDTDAATGSLTIRGVNVATKGDLLFSDNRIALRFNSVDRIEIDNNGIGVFNATPVAQTAGYTLNATVVQDRTLLASASATTINNNNVLAAILTDMQAYGWFG